MAIQRLKHLHLVLQRSASQHLSSHQPLAAGAIKVTPEVSRFDEKVHIKVQGLPSGSKVTLQASTLHEWRKRPVKFVSCSHHVSSPQGEVDLWKDASLGGTYIGVDPMGLLWSLQPCPSGPRNVRMVIKDVERPVLYALSVHPGHLSLKELSTDTTCRKTLCEKTLERIVKPDHVRRIPVREGKLRGTLFLPPGDGPFPAVLDMFGLAGGLMEIRAALLAANGFASLALPFYRYDDLPEKFEDQTFEYFEHAASWLASHPSVKAGGIGITAISGGASVGLMMAWRCPEVKAFVRINGQGFHSLQDFHHQGKLIRRGVGLDMEKCPDLGEGRILKHGWIFSKDDFIPLWEREDVHMLVLVSNDDGQVEPGDSDNHLAMYPEDRRHLVDIIHYPGAGHLLEPPYTPLCRTCYNPFFGADLLWGGYPKEHAMAQEDSWQRILQFFKNHLGT